MSVTYGYRLEWRPTPRSGTRAVSTEGHLDPETAKSTVIHAAEKWGYRRPRLWEYWRRQEMAPTMIIEREVSHAAS